MAEFKNAYEDPKRAAEYAKMEFPGTYFTAFRDLPLLYQTHVKGDRALDFGCGTGRSTRFLEALGFKPVGIDISADMLKIARELGDGDFRLISDGDFSCLQNEFDLIQCAFPFDNVPDASHRISLFKGLAGCLAVEGKLVILGATPDMYFNEWASFTTKEFLDFNRKAKSGGVVRIVTYGHEDSPPVEDILWLDSDYREQLAAAGLRIVEKHLAFGKDGEPTGWATEKDVAPFAIYIAERART